MSRSDELGVGTASPFRDYVEARWQRFVLASVVFLAYETAFMWPFQSDVDWSIGDGWFAVAYIVLVGGATLGYFAYGMFAGSIASGLVVLLSFVIAWYLDNPADLNDPRGEILPLVAVWVYFAIFFLPAWLLGVLAGYVARSGTRGL
jgi:hypothetical protein